MFELIVSLLLAEGRRDREALLVIGDGCGKVDESWWFDIPGCVYSF